MKPITRRTFHSAIAAGLAGTAVAAVDSASLAVEDTEAKFVGPMVGHVSATTARIWFQPAKADRYRLVATAGDAKAGDTKAGDAKEFVATATAEPEHDLTMTFDLTGLSPQTRYRYAITDVTGKTNLVRGDEFTFETPPHSDQPAKVSLAFGSCAHTKPLKLWSQIADAGVDGLVLLGDTPYIDSTDLAVAREKHRKFLQVPELAQLIRQTPTWATWDDHDFGRNDSDGRLKGKENTRQAFVEYRANANFGGEDGKSGIYTKFRVGPVEVFLLDTRWFARTVASPVAADKPTLLGKAQWLWLLDSLKASTAEFKVIACGMIWDDKENSESDDWGTYTHERTALFDFLGKEKIAGAILIGGDIHCSRLLKYKTEKQVGYPLYQAIVSPIHSSTIPSLNVAHPDLIHGEAIPHVWLKLDADTTADVPTLHLQWLQMEGKEMWDLKLTSADLRTN